MYIVADVPVCGNDSLICNRPKYCTGHDAMRIMDANGCTGYYECIFGEFVRYDCGAGLIFDTSNQFCQCIFGDASDCESPCTPTDPTPTGPPGTNTFKKSHTILEKEKANYTLKCFL